MTPQPPNRFTLEEALDRIKEKIDAELDRDASQENTPQPDTIESIVEILDSDHNYKPQSKLEQAIMDWLHTPIKNMKKAIPRV
jgi:hypothetical protein